MKIGDKVRFLSEVGGGKVAGFQGKDIVLVEDPDGFQIPTAISDVVVVDDEDYSTGRIVENKKKSQTAAKQIIDDEQDYDPADRPITFRAPVEERKGGDKLSVYVAFVPVEPKMLTTTRFEMYIVNDSNYDIAYSMMSHEGAGMHLRAVGEVESNTKLFVEEIGRDELSEIERLTVQLMAYKRSKAFMPKPAFDVCLRIDGVKFYKLHTFRENDFFEQPALLYTVVENDVAARQLVVDPAKLKQQMMGKITADNGNGIHAAGAGGKNATTAEKNAAGPLVVDLHISELLETTAGMTNTDMINHQLEVFRKTIRENEKNTGMKIVFIHGKGDGVLRHAIINELRYRFKTCTYQDASFREYGYGATQVTIK